jgi:hypothetical protein
MPLLAKLMLVAAGTIFMAAALCLRLWDLYRVQIATRWPTVDGRILAATVATDETHDAVVYRAALRYSYRAGDSDREGCRLCLLKHGRTAKRAEAEAVITRYPVGAAVLVRYDPANPAWAFLELDAPPGKYLWLGTIGLALISIPLFVPGP